MERLPKIIWMYWHQGFDRAPFIVHKCVESWRKHNPTWEIRLLDSKTLSDHIAFDLSHSKIRNLSLPHKSDLIRLKLLKEFGGVWVDSTVLCRKPLNNWLKEHFDNGIFMFTNPGKDRIISNWFIAAEKNHYIINMLDKTLSDFWHKNTYQPLAYQKSLVGRILERMLSQNKSSTLLWFNPFVQKILRVYPYFVFHYLFYLLLRKDAEFSNSWRHAGKLDSSLPLFCARFGYLNEVTPDAKKVTENQDISMFKLSWEIDYKNASEKSVIKHLLV